MAKSFKVNYNYQIKNFSSNYGELKKLPLPSETDSRLQKQYENLQETLSNAGQTFDSRNWMEKLLGINSDTKEHAGILRGTLDVVTRPLDAVKASVFDLQHGKSGQEVMQSLLQGITQGKGKNLTGVQILGLENAHLDTFTKFIVNVGVDIGLDPLTYVPAGAIFKGLKKVGANTSKLPGISELLQHTKNTEFGVATKNLYTTTKNQFGKMFKWMYGTSDDTKFLFKKYESDRIFTTHELMKRNDTLFNIREEAANELFLYTKTGQIPGSKSAKEIFSNINKSRQNLDKTLDLLGISNPEKTFKIFAENNYNGNIFEAKKNLLEFITDPNNKYYAENWKDFVKSGTILNPDGTQKNTLEMAESFWQKITKEWEQLTPTEVKMRWQEAIYNDYLLANPAERTLETIIKGLNNGEIVLPTNDPEGIRTFLNWFSETTGIDDPLLNAKWIERQVKDSSGKTILNIDKNAIQKVEKELQTAQNTLKSYGKEKVKEIKRLEEKIKLLNKNLETLKKGKIKTEILDISNGISKQISKELGINSTIPSSYFNIESLESYGETYYKNYQRTLQKMSISKDPAIRLEYMKMMRDNQMSTVASWLKNAKGNGVKISVKNNWNPEGLKYLDESGNIISQSQNAIKLSKYKTGDAVKKIINKEIEKGLKTYLKGQLTEDILSNGILGKVVNDWKQLDGLTNENVFNVANKLTNDLLLTKVEMPAFKLTPFKGYLSKEYIQELTFINSEMGRLLERFDLDPTKLQKANILRNVTNPELATHIKLANIQKNLDTNNFFVFDKINNYHGLDPSKVLNSKWFLNAPEINNALGFKLISTDPLQSMAQTLKVLPESLGFAAMMKSATKSGDIRVLNDLEKVNYEIKKMVPSGKKLIKSNEITKRLESIRELVPKNEFESFEKLINNFGEETNLLISVGLDDQLTNIVKVKNEAPSIVNFLNKYISAWKKVVLLTPGYHMRNMFGNFSQTVSAGIPMHIMTPELNVAFQDINNIRKITDKVGTKLSSTKEILDTPEKVMNFTKTFLSSYEHNLFHEYTNLARNGVTSQSKISAEYWEMFHKIGRTAQKNNNFKKGWDTVFNANMKVSQAMDDGFRLAAYRISLKNPNYAKKMGLAGKNAEELSQSFVRTVFFDYNALTNFEKNTMRKIFPFYTWSRKNLEYQVQTLINRPEKFSRMLKIFNDWEKAQEYNSEETPDWVKDNMWLPIVKGDNVKFLKLGLPQQDLNSIFSGNGQILSRLNPFYKIVLESITGQNVFTGENTTPAKSIQGMFWQPVQKLLVQPFDIPVGALPLGNGKTLGEVFGHPDTYTQKTSMWYEQNIQSLYQSYLWQQINKLTAFRQQLRASGIDIQTNQQIIKQLKNQSFPTKPKLQQFKQFKIRLKDFNF